MKKLVVVLAILLGGAGGLYVAATSPQDVRLVSGVRGPGSGIRTDRVAIGLGVVEVRITEGELTTLARREAEREGYTEVSDLNLACEPGEIIASLHYALAGIQFPVLGHVQPEAADGKIKVTVSGTRVGSIPVPIEMSQYVQGALDQTLGTTGVGITIRARKVTVEHGSVRIEAEPAAHL